MVKGFEGKFYEEWLRSLGISRRLRGDFIAVCERKQRTSY